MNIEYILTKFLNHRDIVNCEREVYLRRWYLIRTPKLGVFIHKFVRSDEDFSLHDHPFNFIVIPIWQGYLEHTNKGIRRVYPFLGIRYRKAEYCHRVELINEKQAWSLFIRFKKRRSWGFWPNGIFVHWQKWWNDLCED